MNQEQHKLEREEYDQALKFASSIRGQFILSQALHHAIIALDSVDGADKELSNMEDMKYLAKHVFPLYFKVPVEEMRAW